MAVHADQNWASENMALAVAVALCLHALVITQLHFDWMNPGRRAIPESLDVILVDWASERPPDQADFLAQASQRGGGDNPAPERPLEPAQTYTEPEPRLEDRPVSPAAAPTQAAVPDPVVTVDEPDADPMIEVEQSEWVEQPPDALHLLEQSRRIARLTPDPQTEVRSAPEALRRKFISANTREHLFASYMRAWVAKVERIGNMNYPEAARRQNLEGSLVLSVDIHVDGSIDNIRVLRSSGFELLDEAAVRIVRLAAPYAELPPEIREQVDVLTITRTWQFSVRSGLR